MRLILRFKIYYKTKFFQGIYLRGDISEFGVWKFEDSKRFSYCGDYWVGEIVINNPKKLSFQYKYVMCQEEWEIPSKELQWEENTVNRTIDLHEMFKAKIEDGDFVCEITDFWNIRSWLLLNESNLDKIDFANPTQNVVVYRKAKASEDFSKAISGDSKLSKEADSKSSKDSKDSSKDSKDLKTLSNELAKDSSKGSANELKDSKGCQLEEEKVAVVQEKKEKVKKAGHGASSQPNDVSKEGGDSNSYVLSENHTSAFMILLNDILKNEKELQNVLPMKSNKDLFFNAVNSPLLPVLIRKLYPDTIDFTKIHVNSPLDKNQINVYIENL